MFDNFTFALLNTCIQCATNKDLRLVENFIKFSYSFWGVWNGVSLKQIHVNLRWTNAKKCVSLKAKIYHILNVTEGNQA